MLKRHLVDKTLFVVSDIHGHCEILSSSLAEAGFDPKNPKHLLVVIGDLFDRGTENKQVLDFLSEIENKILLRGNHEDILLKALTSGLVNELQANNGTVRTLLEFFPAYSGSGYLPWSDSESRETREMLIRHISSMGCYLETENYILTHGWLPVDNPDTVMEDWRHASYARWYLARWHRWKDFYGRCEIPDGKTLVIGHTPVIYYARGFDPKRRTDCSTPFYGKQMIAIDACTVQSGRINVLVLNDAVPEAVKVTKSVTCSVYDAMLRDGASIYVDLCHEDMRELLTGDILELVCEGREPVSRRVVSTYYYPTLADIEDFFSPEQLGITSEGSLIGLYRGSYGVDELGEYGCLAIALS